ncbi:glycosyltransferase [Salipaludibacillus neizhouensis]|nr:glycosyltransferase [Salipaludibacillus neizhouensis]
MEMKYSVLMSVYHKENPEYFRESVESMLNQSVTPDEIVIVKDGPLNDTLEKVVEYLDSFENVKFISLEKNLGLGKALEIGIENCKNEYIARMDTDDISIKNRCEKQLDYFQRFPDLSLVGTSISEFIGDSNNIVSYRRVPTEDQDIKKYMRTRSPFNHPSVMFKKSDVINAGSYKHWYLNEDYYLWVRMLLSKCKFANINEPLLKMRINEDTFFRRGGWAYFMTQKKLFDYMFERKVINIGEYLYNNIVRFIARLLVPNNLRAYIYRRVLRKQSI